MAKPSELTPSTALLLAKLLCDPRVGLPPGVFNVVHGEGAVVGKSLCTNEHVSAMSFTGGTKTGAEVAPCAWPSLFSFMFWQTVLSAELVTASFDSDQELCVSPNFHI